MDTEFAMKVVWACAGITGGILLYSALTLPFACMLGRYLANNGVHPSELEPDPELDLDLLEAELAMEFHRPVALAA